MRVIERRMRLTALSLITILCASVFPTDVFADDGNPSGAALSGKIDAAKAGLTERERWLLDRVEQLERRVEELESKSPQPVAPEPTASQARTNGAANSAGPGGATPTTATPATIAPADALSSSSNPVIAPQEQATEKGRPGSAGAG